MKPTPPIPSTKEEKPKFISICNRGEFFVESKEIKLSLGLEEISPTSKILDKIKPSLEEYNGVVHDKLLKILCNAPILQVWRCYCDVYAQGENTLTHTHTHIC